MRIDTLHGVRCHVKIMGTFLRRLFYAAACVSTLLLVAALILWPVSHNWWMGATYGTGGKTRYAIDAESGRAGVQFQAGFDSFRSGLHFDAGIIANRELDHWSYLSWKTAGPANDSVLGQHGLTSMGIFWHQGHYTSPDGDRSKDLSEASLLIPFSYLALSFAILPALAFRSLRRRRKAAQLGLCPKCRYDLRAHEPGARCPECGTSIEKVETPMRKGL